MKSAIWTALLVLLVSVQISTAQEENEANIHLLIERNSMVVYIAATQPLSLDGLAFRVINTLGDFETRNLSESFSILRLTDSIAQPGSCFVYSLASENPVLPSVCRDPNFVFRLDVPPSDVFWFDFISNRQRDIAILSNDKATGAICPASSVDCRLTYVGREAIASAPELPETSTSTVLIRPVQASEQSLWEPQVQTFSGLEMVLVPPGCFNMGSEDGDPDEKPVHQQCFEFPFWIGHYEVTNSQYGRSGRFSGGELPREMVTWDEALEFCVARNMRLPTESEWEYAGRGPQSLVYPWGNDYRSGHAIDLSNSDSRSQPVGSLESGRSWVGAMDMSGNLWEWTSSVYLPYPYRNDALHETITDGPSYRVMRGGSWKTPNQQRTRLSFRSWADSETMEDWLGFRCARDVQPSDFAP